MKVKRIIFRRHSKRKGTYKDIEASIKVQACLGPSCKGNEYVHCRFAAQVFRVHMEVDSIVGGILSETTLWKNC